MQITIKINVPTVGTVEILNEPEAILSTVGKNRSTTEWV
jgi:hypothetical protein